MCTHRWTTEFAKEQRDRKIQEWAHVQSEYYTHPTKVARSPEDKKYIAHVSYICAVPDEYTHIPDN
jgi:hypothetical protein